MSCCSWLEKQWYRLGPWQLVLLPLSCLVLGAFRAAAHGLSFAAGCMFSVLPVPVIVVGNISVGGTGKTPLVLWLADWLRQQGYRPGIVSRGYGGHSADAAAGRVWTVTLRMSGDEPLLLARQCALPGMDRT